MASRKLRHYFQGRVVVIYSNIPLKRILQKPESSGRLIAWAVELSQFHLDYRPRTAIKGQALADFIVECSFPESSAENSGVISVIGEIPVQHSPWTLYVDGSSNSVASGAGIVLTSPEGFVVQQAIQFRFRATNNEAEYEAVLAGLRLAKSLEVKHLLVFSDSQVIVKQIQGSYEARGVRMIKYLIAVKSLLQHFTSSVFQGIDRESNLNADALSKLASVQLTDLKGTVYMETLAEPSILTKEVSCIERNNCWLTPYLQYLTEGKLPSDKVLAKKIKYRSSYFCLIDGSLYKRSYASPLLVCLVPSEASYVLREVHEGICGDHMGARSLAYKLLRQGYYWPTMFQDAKEYVRQCPKCQIVGSVPRVPSEELSSVLSPIPFAMWGIDILGPLPKAKGQFQFLVVAIDYMTKWIEAKPLRRITEAECLKFFKEAVVYRFGIPMILVSDNGSQFVGSQFEHFLAELHIQHRRTSVAHPQANGQVEVTNRTILTGLKRRLDEAKGKWPEELLSVLWAYRTTPRTTTGDSPFRLSYGTEALLPVEIGSTSYRVAKFNELYNEEGLRLNLDLLDEVRDAAVLRLAAYQRRTARYYNKRVKLRQFEVGDFVLREAEASTPSATGKLMPTWEGPYEIVEKVRDGTYKLRGMDGVNVKNTWHVARLKKYYQ